MSEKPPLPEHRRNTGAEPSGSIEPEGTGAIGRLFKRAQDVRQKHFTRPVTTFTSKEGEDFRAAADQVEIDVEDAGNVKVWLKTHDKEIIMTIGGILLAGSVIGLQRNRSQRKKMNKRDSSYLRQPRKKPEA